MRKNNVKSYNTQPPFLQTMHWTVEIDCGFRSETTIYVTKNEVQYKIQDSRFLILINQCITMVQR